MKRITRKTVHIDDLPDEDRPVTKFPCGARVYGQRLGHCEGPACGWDPGCCRNFWGVAAFDKHFRVVNGWKTCYSDAELVKRGFVQDRPENSWRLATDTSTDINEEETE